ncbi:uncharacterized protein FIBRA_09602 [Fibroporia radiculosa]|uniref:Uncharacterized protein n=1 Tax=Fibroporia radiculosa TaxID=599839 RepID=J7SCK1_9APHY|nr:uncharacterized protein FIBRA_09602 [Fibroporia radiculosa]CCM07256.1 predicted protein [Fibroporia radiculosa]
MDPSSIPPVLKDTPVSTPSLVSTLITNCGTMASSTEAVPPAAKISLITVWMETLVYGINIIAFAGAIWVLAFRRKVVTTAHRYLIATSCFLFSLSTVHVSISLTQLLKGFIDGDWVNSVDSMIEADLYFLSFTQPLAFVKLVLYVVNVFVQDMILIWRMYAVYGANWKIAVVPVFFELVHTGVAMSTTVLGFNGVPLNGERVEATALTGWIMDLIINLGVTAAIAYKLWHVGREVAGMRSDGRDHNAYLGVIFIVLESGVMFATATFIVVVLYLHTPTQLEAMLGVNVVTQVATLSPMLIVVRVGLRIMHGGSTTDTFHTRTSSKTLTAPRFAPNMRAPIDVLRTEENISDIGTNSYNLQDIKANFNGV